MRGSRLLLLFALTGCAGGQQCTLIGCASLLTVTVPASVTQAKACVDGVCTTTVNDGTLQVPLSRKSDETAAALTVSFGGKAYEGSVPLTRSTPNGADCGPVCVSGAARVDIATGRVVPG